MTAVDLPRGICMKRLAPLFGLSMSGIYAAIADDRFPIPTYRRGKGRYANPQVLEAYFEAKKAEGMAALASVTL
jgi:hypothetical protein